MRRCFKTQFRSFAHVRERLINSFTLAIATRKRGIDRYKETIFISFDNNRECALICFHIANATLGG